MPQLRALLLLVFNSLCHPVKEEGVSCLWEEYFHIGHNISGACQLHHPAPPSCRGQSLRLSTDGQFFLPYHQTTDTANFTVPAPFTKEVKLRCELSCPGLQPDKSCDRTILGSYPPSLPSRPQCHIPYNGPDLHCAWHPRRDPLLPTTYTLTWEPVVMGSKFAGSIMASNVSGVIPRKEFYRQSRMTVWVIASNGLGSERSEKATFNTGDVVKPRAPVIYRYIAHPTDLEILWDMQCPSDMLSEESDISCQAQYRRLDQDLWTEGEDVAQDGFLLEGVQLFSVYMFRVRCACPGNNALISNWSEIYTAESTVAAPVGALDVWIDSRPMDEALVWKELPVSRARGRVLGYSVTVERGGEKVTINVSEAKLGPREGKWGRSGHCCRYPLSLRGVTGVRVLASTSQGRTRPTDLALPTAGNSQVSVPLSVSTDTGGRGFNVSWDPPSALAETVQEYVVQQEQAGLGFAVGFDWTRTNKTLRSVILTGDFRNYTPYNLSLFGLFVKHSLLLGSAIAYSQQGVPPLVPEFQVSRISSSDVTLTWEHIALTQRRGVIQYYQLGQGNNTEYTLSRGVTSLQLSGLQPGQTYQFWISAESEAGAGPKRSIKFSTPHHTDYHITTIVVLVSVFILVGVFILLTWLCRRKAYTLFPIWCCERVPDPTNSKLFLQMQILIWTRPSPSMESDPNLTLLEVVEAPPQMKELTVGEVEQEQVDEQEVWRDEEWAGRGRGKNGSAWRGEGEGYNEMVTAEGVGEGEGPSWSATKTFFSGYEKHFIPSPLEVSRRACASDWTGSGDHEGDRGGGGLVDVTHRV